MVVVAEQFHGDMPAAILRLNKNDTCAGADGRRVEFADAREPERALVVDVDAVGLGPAGEELAEAHGVRLEQARHLRAARRVGVPRLAPRRHVRQAVRHVEHRVHALRAEPGRRPGRGGGGVG
jgi:hypothetical protein